MEREGSEAEMLCALWKEALIVTSLGIIEMRKKWKV